MLDLSWRSFGAAYTASFLIGLKLNIPLFLDDGTDSSSSLAASLAKRLKVVDWFGFEFKAFTARILLFVFMVTCIAGLVAVGISEELALGGALGILALSLPIYLVYYVLSRDREGEEEAEDQRGA